MNARKQGGGSNRELKVLYEDNHLLAVRKESGDLVQGDSSGDPCLLSMAKEYLKNKYEKPGKVFLGLVQRLDRPVSGVILFARTSKAASRLSRAFKERQVRKVYLAIVEGAPEIMEGEISSYITRSGKRSRIVDKPSAEPDLKAVLWYKVVAHAGKRSFLEVHPATGRHHQIRLQLSHIGHPIVGDLMYGSAKALPDRSIALHAWKLAFEHPVKKEKMELAAEPPKRGPWLDFKDFF